MEPNKNTEFYNKESDAYEKQRYVSKNNSFVQYLFNTRRKNFTDILNKLVKNNFEVKNILEVACADGVISKSISTIFPNAKIVANDIAPQMIEVAKRRKLNNVDFYVRGDEPEMKYDLIIYLGVFNAMRIEDELLYVNEHLNPNGKFIINFTHKNAFSNLLRKPNLENGGHLLKVNEYENAFEKNFKIIEKRAHSVFIPHLWKLPFANFKQTFTDSCFKLFTNIPMHEQMYVMIKK